MVPRGEKTFPNLPYLTSIFAGRLRPDRVGLANRTTDLGLLRGLLQHLVPPAQAGHDCNPGLQRGGDGELGADHVQGGGHLVRGGQVFKE